MTEKTTPQLDPADQPAIIRRNGHVGHILLNRPNAINALTHDMVTVIQSALDEWADDPAVKTILLTGAGERGLCAGGDIVALYHDAIEGGTASAAFWADEYRLNATIGNYPKPFVAVMDGIVLGGGIGLSAHADIRVVTERSSIGTPETGIGFLPDVGGTYLLSHSPGELGTHLALTAGAVNAADAIAIGLADWYVPTDRLPTLIAALPTTDAHEAVAAVAEPAQNAPLASQRSWIDRYYAGDDVQTIVSALQAAPEAEARAAAATILKKSPTSLTVTLRALRTAARMGTLAEALDQEYRLALRLHPRHDFVEGVRAQVIDKDRNPRWSPATLAEVTDIDAFFTSLQDRELGLVASRQEHVA